MVTQNICISFIQLIIYKIVFYVFRLFFVNILLITLFEIKDWSIVFLRVDSTLGLFRLLGVVRNVS